jgi:hypothetical protein
VFLGQTERLDGVPHEVNVIFLQLLDVEEHAFGVAGRELTGA